MKIANDILIYIIEDDAAQAEILNDKLMEYNAEYSIYKFKNGSDLIEHFKTDFPKAKYHYVILDYYLQTIENDTMPNGIEVIKILGERFPKAKIILFSAFENDDDTSFQELVNEPNVLEFVKKSDHAFSHIQNIIRFDYAHKSLQKHKRRFRWALAIFIALLSLSALHFVFSFLSI